jgi:hypothetical protein
VRAEAVKPITVRAARQHRPTVEWAESLFEQKEAKGTKKSRVAGRPRRLMIDTSAKERAALAQIGFRRFSFGTRTRLLNSSFIEEDFSGDVTEENETVSLSSRFFQNN